MNHGIEKFLPRLSILIPAGIIVWAIACWMLNGPAILAYIGLQAATAGIFAAAMFRMEAICLQQQQKKLVPQPVSVKK